MDLNKKGMTVIYTSHYMDEVEQICTRISIIDKGKLLATGDKYELKKLVGLTDTLILKDIDMKNLDISQLESIEGLGKISLEGSNLSIGIQDNMAMTHIFISPFSNLLKDKIQFIRVVLPDPLGPNRP